MKIHLLYTDKCLHCAGMCEPHRSSRGVIENCAYSGCDKSLLFFAWTLTDVAHHACGQPPIFRLHIPVSSSQ